MSTDTTFVTNEGENNLKDRFRILLTGTRFFDVLVGYFFTSGFYTLLKSVEKTETIRILIGIGTNRNTLDVLEDSKQLELFALSHAEAKQKLGETVAHEMEVSEDNINVEEGANRLVEWIQQGKVVIKAYPSGNIHAKLYIMTFPEGDKDKGRVITGSSNLTQAGLSENLEFNVELKNRSDYEFALAKFNELWKNAVDVSDKYVETITTKTWLSKVEPYELYLKFLYEYFKEKINQDTLGIDRIYVQAKRWNNAPVGHSEIRNFIGALDFKHSERGIFITTSNFTKDIIEKVDRSSKRIILIDGNELARLMITHKVGVSVEDTFELNKLDMDYFVEE